MHNAAQILNVPTQRAPEFEKSAAETAARAARELADAASALRKVHVLLHVLKKTLSDDEYELADIGVDLTAAAAERAQEQADHFAEEA